MRNVLNGLEKPNFDDFRKNRRFQDFTPKIYGAGIKLVHSVEESTKKVLAGGVRQITTTGSLKENGEQKVDTIVTPFDLPRFNGISSNGQILTELNNPKDISLWLLNFFELKTNDSTFIDTMNYLLDRGLYDYNWTYHGNLPRALREYRFSSTQDVYSFIQTANNPRSNHSGIFMQILKCMMGSSLIKNTPKLSQSGRYHKIFLENQIRPNFQIDPDGNGFLNIYGYENPIEFKILHRNKSEESIHKKLFALPKTSENETHNDLGGFEFEVSNKTELIFVLNYIFENIIIKNYRQRKGGEKDENIDKERFLSILKIHWGFDLRQKRMLSEDDIKNFFQENPNHGLHPIIEHILKEGELKEEIRPMTGENMQDIKFQGNYNFGEDLGESSFEIRIVLKGNKNNDGTDHELIRDGERILRVKNRLSSGGFTPGYLSRIASIVLSQLPQSFKTNETTPTDIADLVHHYNKKTEAVITKSGVDIDGLRTFKGENERRHKNGISIMKAS